MKTLFDYDENKILIGSDESLKGDTFGGLVVTAFRANSEEREKLKNIGVKDSKTIADKDIIRLADDLKEYFPNNFSIVSFNPKEYNEQISIHGLTQLLNIMHKQANNKIKTFNSKHVVDKYPGCATGDIIEEKAESKYVEVAAASIIARSEAIRQFHELSIKAGFKLPKGSTHVSEALQEIKKRELKPTLFVKTHFKNVQKALYL
jgi:ribonuclease HIII